MRRGRRPATALPGLVRLLASVALPLAWPSGAHAFSIATQISTGCHERLTSSALRQLRAELPVPALAPTADEQAMIDDLAFVPDADMRDLGAVALLLGVRDNDLKGNDILNSLDIVQLHGNPALQREHCLRAPDHDEPGGAEQALSACRGFIREAFDAALAGLGADGWPDPRLRLDLPVALAIRGRIDVSLPVTWVRLGQAVHTVQDSFAHAYRTADGLRVTTIMNWVEVAEELWIAERDGPAHVGELDECDDLDPLRRLRCDIALRASTELLEAALTPGLSREDRLRRLGVLLDHYLGYQAGCTPANGWCNAPERFYEEAGCRASPGRPGWLTPLVGLALIALVRRRSRATLAALTLLPALAGAPVHAAAPDQNGDALPTPAELAALREVLRPGPWVGFVAALGASVDRTALAGSLGVRFRASPKWLLGLDVEWNPWFTTSPARMRSGALNLQAILIRRYQLRLSRIALRTTLRLGMSVLLFDLYGAPQGSVGPYVGLAPLGVEVALGSGWRVVIDPIDWELPVPHVTGAPLYYPQYRLLVSLQFGG